MRIFRSFGFKILVVFILLLTAISWVMKKPSEEPVYKLRGFDPDRGGDHASLLLREEESSLLPHRCTMPFINDGEDKYFWRLPYQHDLYDEVEEQVFKKAIAHMQQNAPENQFLISGRFCETQTRDIIVDYYYGDREESYVTIGSFDGIDVTGYIAYVDESGSLSDPIEFIKKDSWSHTGCQPLMQITKNHLTYIMCSMLESHTGSSELYTIDMKARDIIQLLACQYSWEGDIEEKTCTDLTTDE